MHTLGPSAGSSGMLSIDADDIRIVLADFAADGIGAGALGATLAAVVVCCARMSTRASAIIGRTPTVAGSCAVTGDGVIESGEGVVGVEAAVEATVEKPR